MLDEEKFNQYINELWQNPLVQKILNEYYQLKYEHYNNCLTWLANNQLLAFKNLLFPEPTPLPPLLLNNIWKVNSDNTISSREIVNNPLSQEQIVNYNLDKIKNKVGGLDNIKKINKISTNDQILIGLTKNDNDDFYKINLFDAQKIDYNPLDTINNQHQPSPLNMHMYNTAEKELHKLKSFTFLTKLIIPHTQIRDNEVIIKLNNSDPLYHHDTCFQATNQVFITKLTTMITNKQMSLKHKSTCAVRKLILKATQPQSDIFRKINSCGAMLTEKNLKEQLERVIHYTINENKFVMKATTSEDFSEYIHYQNIGLYNEKLLNALLTRKITQEKIIIDNKLKTITQQITKNKKKKNTFSAKRKFSSKQKNYKQIKHQPQTASPLLISTLNTIENTTDYQNKNFSNTATPTNALPFQQLNCSSSPILPVTKQPPTNTEMNWNLFDTSDNIPQTLATTSTSTFEEIRFTVNSTNIQPLFPIQEEINKPTNVSATPSQQTFRP